MLIANSKMSDSEYDLPELSTEAQAALNEFYAERAEKEKILCSLEKGETLPEAVQFDEDWQLSQFWYDDKTAAYLSKEAIRVAGQSGKIALVSCPTLYRKLKSEIYNNQVVLFEFDKRFAIYEKEFIFYDYKFPLDIPRQLAGTFDIVIADPPFLSEECITKTAVTVKFLAKDKIILCTGAKMEELANKLLDVRKCKFEPHHKNNLANEFYCYSNFDMDVP